MNYIRNISGGLKLLLAVMLISFYSCGKKWKKPAEISALFQLKNSGSGLVNISSGSAVIEEIDFDGNRKQGENHISFQKKFENGKTIFLSRSASGSGIIFDIPQGTYTSIDISLQLREANSNSSLRLYGTYIDSSGNPIPVVFDLFADESIDIHATQSGGGTEIVLIADNPANINFTFNPLYWFQLVTQSMLKNANLTDDLSGVKTMYINKNDNQNIYNVIIDRINNGNEAIFN